MPYGILLTDLDPVPTKANFYVPTINKEDRTLPSSLKCSHLYYDSPEDVAQMETHLDALSVPREINILVDYSPDLDLNTYWQSLKSLSREYIMCVPVLDDLDYWYALRDLPGRSHVVLRYTSSTTKDILARYKCLDYIAVIASSSTLSNCSYLLENSARPSLLLESSLASEESYQFWDALAHPKLPLYSDVLIEPLQPLATDMDLSIYETFEKDSVKYNQYDNAISMALDDLRGQHPEIHILVIGPGRGPLLSMVLEHCHDSDTITAIEKNPKCLDILEKQFGSHQNTNLICGDVRDLPNLGKYHLVVSELIGSWACNEACPEILGVFTGSKAIFIPSEITNFIQPIYTDRVIDGDSALYVANLTCHYSIHKPREVFSYQFPKDSVLNQTKKIIFEGSHKERVNALYGFFEAVLYGPYRISIKPDASHLEFCSSWYPAVFPIECESYPLEVIIERHSSEKLTYSWNVNGTQHGEGYYIGL